MGKKKVAQKTGEGLTEEKLQEQITSSAGKKRSSKKIEGGVVYINASYNNTIITVTDTGGNVVAWSTAGSLGFSGPKKATPFAASKVVDAIVEKIKKTGPTTIDIMIKGVGSGRDSAIRSFASKGFVINTIKDVTPIPHNGPRPKKVRRV